MKKVSDVNLWGMVTVTKIFLPLLKKSKGRIVNVSSICGRTAFPSVMSYSISKYGVEAFSDCLRLEMKSWGISVHIIEPAGFKTTIFDKAHVVNRLTQAWEQLDPSTKEEYGEGFLNSGKIYKFMLYALYHVDY